MLLLSAVYKRFSYNQVSLQYTQNFVFYIWNHKTFFSFQIIEELYYQNADKTRAFF